MYEKTKKRTPTLNNFVIVFPSKFRGINSHATWGTAEGDVCISSVTCCASYKEDPGVAGSASDVGWGARWWRGVGGRAEHKRWAASVERLEM